MKGKRRDLRIFLLSFESLFFFFILSFPGSVRRREGKVNDLRFRIFAHTHAHAHGAGGELSWGRRCSEGVKEGGGQHGLVCWNANWDGWRRGRERESREERREGGPRPSRKFPRAARFRCPVHIITVLRIPTPEIVRALVALRALLSRFLPVFFTPPSLGLPAKLPHQRRIIVVHAGIRIIRAGSDDGCRRMRLAPRVESAREKR